MITEIDTNIPQSTNDRVIDSLMNAEGWYFGKDHTNNNFKNPDAGFTLMTFQEDRNICANTDINAFGLFIFDIVRDKYHLKFKSINRVFWNFYNKNSVMNYHIDRPEDIAFSIVYNFSDNDGGTSFRVKDDETIFKKSVASQALVFPSKLFHKGIAPKNAPNRAALNIVAWL
jgi:hypothetical protein|tara:strand:- start:326 stop:841 length:516 start_codon:yes stop_codon:yes gene_type:complete